MNGYMVTDGMADHNDYFVTLGWAMRELDDRKSAAWVVAPDGYVVACNFKI
jgi:hypothetical protein